MYGTCKQIVAGYDGGNGLAKASFRLNGESDTTFVRMPSYLYQLNGRDSLPASGKAGAVLEYLDGTRTDLAGTRWILGTTAYNNQPKARASVVESRSGKVDYGLQMFLGCLASLELEGTATIKVATSVHNRTRWAAEMKTAFNGAHHVRLNGQELRVSIQSGCVEEGHGALYYLQANRLIGDNLIAIADLGYGTTGARVYEKTKGGFSVIQGSEFILDMGVRNLMQEVAKHESLSGPLKGEADIEIVRASIEAAAMSGNSIMRYGQTNLDMATAYRTFVKVWVERCLAAALDALRNWEAQAVFYCIGGGSKLPGVEPILKQINPATGKPYFQSIANAHLVNAEGLLIAAGAIK